MMSVVDVLLANFDEAFDKKGWHGTTLRGALRGLGVGEVVWRPDDGRHNIWELAMHCAYWKYAVRRRLTGEKRGMFPVKGSNFFPLPAEPDDRGWREVVEILDHEHAQLRDTIGSLPKAAFGDPKRVRLIYGAAAHDLYHTGQIQLIKRLQR